MIVTQVEKGSIAANNSTFVAFYTKPYHHYQNSDECRQWGEEAWFAKVPLIGVLSRWDASLGFVGGQVDRGENLYEAAIRECREEIGAQIRPEQLTLVCSHKITKPSKKTQNTHFFVCEVTPEEMYDLQKRSITSIHSRIECSGFNVIPLVDRSFDNLMKSPWAGTGKQELEILFNSDFFEKYSHEVNEKAL